MSFFLLKGQPLTGRYERRGQYLPFNAECNVKDWYCCYTSLVWNGQTSNTWPVLEGDALLRYLDDRVAYWHTYLSNTSKLFHLHRVLAQCQYYRSIGISNFSRPALTPFPSFVVDNGFRLFIIYHYFSQNRSCIMKNETPLNLL